MGFVKYQWFTKRLGMVSPALTKETCVSYTNPPSSITEEFVLSKCHQTLSMRFNFNLLRLSQSADRDRINNKSLAMRLAKTVFTD